MNYLLVFVKYEWLSSPKVKVNLEGLGLLPITLSLMKSAMLSYFFLSMIKEMPLLYQRVWDYPYDFCLEELEIDKKVGSIHDISMQHMLDLKKAGLAMSTTTDRENKYGLMINPFETGF